MTKFQTRVHEALLSLGGYASCGDIAETIGAQAVHVSAAAGRMSDFIDVRLERVEGRQLVMLHALKPKPKEAENGQPTTTTWD